MIKQRLSQERGFADHGWLKSYHSFSFADYYDPQWMGFRQLRVINDDIVSPGHGFDTHPHRDMEIITVVLEGQLAHQDSMGNHSIIRPGEVQRMTAGSGVYHSEYNHSKDQRVHLLQIWIQPQQKGLPPSYEQKVIYQHTPLTIIASPQPNSEAVLVHQDVTVVKGLLQTQAVTYAIKSTRGVWIHVIKGALTVNHLSAETGDSFIIEGETHIELATKTTAEFLLFDLA